MKNTDHDNHGEDGMNISVLERLSLLKVAIDYASRFPDPDIETVYSRFYALISNDPRQTESGLESACRHPPPPLHG